MLLSINQVKGIFDRKNCAFDDWQPFFTDVGTGPVSLGHI